MEKYITLSDASKNGGFLKGGLERCVQKGE